MGSDPYRILGVGRDATSEEVRAAFRKKVRESHPDTSSEPDDAAGVSEVIEAYRLLIDPDRRAGFDAGTRRAPGSGARRVSVKQGRSNPVADAASGDLGVCESCRGSGVRRSDTDCPDCRGRGEMTSLAGVRAEILRCRSCGGAGRLRSTRPCSECGGSGLLDASKV